jgi:proteasome lid subunit RPN8/RPN11
MSLILSAALLAEIHADGAAAYPEEGAGLLLGSVIGAGTAGGDSTAGGEARLVTAIYSLRNARENGARHNRYLITPQELLHGEQEAAQRGLDVLGIFHSHPDHPNRPSEFDREWALPWYSYVITSIAQGQAVESRSWRLAEDRSEFSEEDIRVSEVNSE